MHPKYNQVNFVLVKIEGVILLSPTTQPAHPTPTDLLSPITEAHLILGLWRTNEVKLKIRHNFGLY